MHFFATVTALGASWPLASRAFAPLFIVSMLARYPEVCDFLHVPQITLPPELAWLAAPWFVTTVGVLAVLECLADKNPELKEFMDTCLLMQQSS